MTSIDSSGPKGMVARLRRCLDVARERAAYDREVWPKKHGNHLGADFIEAWADDTDTLLSIVERFAETEPVDEHGECAYCIFGAGGHAPDCPWLLARRVCGMEDEP